ncbi:hypothetical protein SARC_06052 [Sphaeroforma arctica JP610]|uniref:RNA-editing substrate-binding complex 6 protein domain-containing protein n=1 Tax=Sphaeroforma arctica JP610 TaxID=667725 RepID=A0A0L0FYD5_9EUKA|nr:hypothetical protein SARC_06052 [Sphaeroforma arctica JP610]KNC81629.1 hypothetical protein SARC_06052 [Sphaeroforma arctica JP610]|eukprot:XP_014155531.1 hypothetical protein SARC_06052 [Sphaeroforma arctica JP610]
MGRKSIVPRTRGGPNKGRANNTHNKPPQTNTESKATLQGTQHNSAHHMNSQHIGSHRGAQGGANHNGVHHGNARTGRHGNVAPRKSGGSVSKSQMGYNKSLATLNDARSIFGVINSSLDDFNLINCATALQRLAKARDFNANSSYDVQPLLLKAAHHIQTNPQDCEARQLSGLLWACGKLGIRNEPLEESVQHAALQHFEEFKPQELSNMLWGMAKTTAQRTGLVQGLAKHIATSLRRDKGTDFRSGWTPQGVSNVVWSLASFGEWGVRTTAAVTDVLPALSSAVAERAQLFNAQECANTLYGFAKLQEHTDATTQCSEGISHLTTRLIHDTQWVAANAFTAQQITNVTWAAAKLGLSANAPLMATLESACEAVSARMNSQELSMVLWAFMTLTCANHSVFNTLATCAAQKADTATAQQMATATHAMAKVGLKNDRMMTVFAERAVTCTSDFDKEPRDVAFLAWAYAKLDVRAPHLFKVLSSVGVRQLKRVTVDADYEPKFKKGKRDNASEYTPQHLTMLLFAFAVLNIRDQTFIAEAVRVTACLLQDYNPRDLTNTTWALCELGLTADGHPQLVARISKAARDRLSAFNSQELLKFLGAYERMGGADSELTTAVTSKRTIEYEFPALGNTITLTSETPKDHEGSVRTRVDNNCGGHGRGNTGVTLWEGSHVLAEWLSRVAHPLASPALRCALQGAWDGSAREMRVDGKTCQGVEGNADAEHSNSSGGAVVWQGRTGVEIGAGLGLPSIVASNLGIRMVATDGDDDVLRLLRDNMSSNGCTDARVEKLVWGDKEALHTVSDGTGRHPDLILASDVVYGNDPKQWRKLVRTLVALSGPNTLVLLANVQRYPVHHPLAETKFYTESTAKHFTRSEVPTTELAPKYQRTGAGSCVIHVLRQKQTAATSKYNGASVVVKGKARDYAQDKATDASANLDACKQTVDMDSAHASFQEKRTKSKTIIPEIATSGSTTENKSISSRKRKIDTTSDGNGTVGDEVTAAKNGHTPSTSEHSGSKESSSECVDGAMDRATKKRGGKKSKKQKRSKKEKNIKREATLVALAESSPMSADNSTEGRIDPSEGLSDEEDFPEIEFDGYVYR